MECNMIEKIKELEEIYVERKADRKFLACELENMEKNLNRLEEGIEDIKQAKEILVQIGMETQNLFKEKIEKLVTSCLVGVFDRDYEFVMQIEVKRNKTEAKPMIKKGALLLDPRGTMGGGVLDIAAFSMRVVIWSMENPRSAPIIVMDEPFKFVHGFEEEAGNVLKRLSKGIGIQFIIVTQIKELIKAGDRIFFTSIIDEKTKVEDITDFVKRADEGDEEAIEILDKRWNIKLWGETEGGEYNE